jgi:sugar phosphate isomerase/epimerase
LIHDVDRENVGITIDNGHIVQNGENMAQVVELCARFGKLLNLHLKDNYGTWDDEMIVGSIHLIEHLKFMYASRKSNYQG